MTRDEVLKLADKHATLTAGWIFNANTMQEMVNEAIAAEREACARVVEQYTGAWSDEGYALSQAIRGRC